MTVQLLRPLVADLRFPRSKTQRRTRSKLLQQRRGNQDEDYTSLRPSPLKARALSSSLCLIALLASSSFLIKSSAYLCIDEFDSSSATSPSVKACTKFSLDPSEEGG